MQNNLLNYTVQGELHPNQPPIIVIHGLFGSLENLNSVAKDIAHYSQVISVDVRNHGNSFHHRSMAYNDMAADILTLMAHLNIEKAILLGHSMGGKIAMQCALNAPEKVEKLIVADIAPVTYQHSHQQIIAGLKSINPDAIENRKQADEKLKAYVQELGVRQFLLKNLAKAEDGFYWRANINYISDAYDQVIAGNQSESHFDKPVLFIKGSQSDYIKPEHRPHIVAFFPNAKAKIIQGAGHWLHAEKPAAFNKIVKDFILNS
ncbi:alpha/beta fold hydrolase [Thalassotalea aquiviva]|uniref:alpha/beta fold hydrolase n=1 Tax=Thalassotalea aquiviva TaxID=3242415 RepID=UPI00352A2852